MYCLATLTSYPHQQQEIHYASTSWLVACQKHRMTEQSHFRDELQYDQPLQCEYQMESLDTSHS